MVKTAYGQVLLSLCLVLFLSACSSKPVNKKVNTYQSNREVSNYQPMQRGDLLYLVLLNEYQYWAGSPYQFGGNSKGGVDCSSLVQQVYRNTFNITLPRTTELQARQGYSIHKKDLKVGDLIFFKTGWNNRHVGIYMGQGEFFHASTSKGVIMSKLESPYWKKYYWQSRRVI